MQQSIAAIGTGWGSSGGGGGGHGHGWNLLALEALSLTEYEEVVVLDQKASVFMLLRLAGLKEFLLSEGCHYYLVFCRSDVSLL